jgi:hypothetical protein
MLTLQHFALDDHVTIDTTPSATPSWLRMDSVTLSWLLSSLSVDLQATVCECGDTSRQVWLAIQDQFLGTYEARTLYINTQFCNYCHRMKTMYDDLRDLSAYIYDCTLILNLL